MLFLLECMANDGRADALAGRAPDVELMARYPLAAHAYWNAYMEVKKC